MSLAIHSRNFHKRHGSHNRAITPEVKAANVARSILDNGLDTTQEATWIRYNLQDNPAQRLLVLAALSSKAVR